MSVSKMAVIAALSPPLPSDVVQLLVDDYMNMHLQLSLRHFRPSELESARFAESVVRILQFLDKKTYTPPGTHLKDPTQIINVVSSNTAIPESIRFHVAGLAKVMIDIRNKRNVAHSGGVVDPNYADSLVVCHCADWILIELVRHFFTCSIDKANEIVRSINELKIPIVADVNGFLRVQDSSLDARSKTLVVLYYKKPASVVDTKICEWIRYGNLSRFRSQILRALDDDAMIHWEKGECVLLPKGQSYVEKNIRLEILT